LPDVNDPFPPRISYYLMKGNCGPMITGTRIRHRGGKTKGQIMKSWLLTVAGLGVGIGVGLSLNRPKAGIIPPSEAAAESTPAQSPDSSPQTTNPTVLPGQSPQPAPDGATTVALADAANPTPAQQVHPNAVAEKLAFDQAVQTILSPQASYQQKKDAWQQLKDTGKLDQAVGQLEQLVAGNPQSAADIAALGQAYMKQCDEYKDIRDKAILVMKADQTFDAALNVDPSNWDARFNKAVGMSYWPPELNKTQEVFQQFQTLIQQQEAEPPQPQFALPYVWLGDQYQKAGYPDEATQTWQRGAALFPDNSQLRKKLASAQ
jgi:tetratricopeptide (TPR) repeat protein